MLAEILGPFTEGFETADLKGAKALLDELNEKPVRSALGWYPSPRPKISVLLVERTAFPQS